MIYKQKLNDKEKNKISKLLNKKVQLMPNVITYIDSLWYYSNNINFKFIKYIITKCFT